MFLAAIIACATMQAESCTLFVNNRQAFYSFDECYENANMVAQAVIDAGRVYSTSPYCFPLELGEPA
jgi:hypothetical protein